MMPGLQGWVAFALMAVVAAACGGDAGREDAQPSVLGTEVSTTPQAEPESTTSTGPEASSAPATTATTAATTTTTTEATTVPTTTVPTTVSTTTVPTTVSTTGATTTTVPATIVAATFDFTGGPGPKFSVAVSVSPSADGPWEPAGTAPGPVIDAPEYFVRFDVQSLDVWGFMTELTVDSNLLGFDLCSGLVSEADPLVPDVPPGNPDATVTCVAGPFPVLGGEQSVAYVTPENAGFRQGDERGFFTESILPPVPIPAEHVFTFFFEPPTGSVTGKAVSGNTPQTTVDLGIGLSGPIIVDCSDTFGNGFSDFAGGTPDPAQADPGIVAFGIWVFDAGGGLTAQCEDIPRFDDPFDNVDGPDGTLFYTGANPG